MMDKNVQLKAALRELEEKGAAEKDQVITVKTECAGLESAIDSMNNEQASRAANDKHQSQNHKLEQTTNSNKQQTSLSDKQRATNTPMKRTTKNLSLCADSDCGARLGLVLGDTVFLCPLNAINMAVFVTKEHLSGTQWQA